MEQACGAAKRLSLIHAGEGACAGANHSHLLKMRMEGGLEGIELGPLLGKGSYGRVFKGGAPSVALSLQPQSAGPKTRSAPAAASLQCMCRSCSILYLPVATVLGCALALSGNGSLSVCLARYCGECSHCLELEWR